MRSSWLQLAFTALFLMAACAGFPFFGRSEAQRAGSEKDTAAEPGTGGGQPQALMEMQEIQYDGKLISGRLLITPKTEKLRLDRRILSTIDVSVDAVWDCGGKPVDFMMVESVARPARQEDLLILEGGYWYGKTIRLPVFGTHITGPGPACIDVELSLLSYEGRSLGTLRVHAEQSVPLPADGGVEVPPPSPDAGLP